MNKMEFLEKALMLQNCPSDFENVYREFNEYQNLALSTLKEIHRVCELNHIDYRLTDGTLLGAIRNGGQIPWDYDIDIAVPLESKKLLIEALSKDLSKDYYFYCPEVAPKCRHFMVRVTPVGYRSEELHVDIFYFIGAPDSEDERRYIAQRYIDMIEHRYSRFVNIHEAAHGRIRTAINLLYRKLNSYRYNINKEFAEFNSYAQKYPYKESKYILRADQFGWDKRYEKGNFRTYYSEDFVTTVLYETNDGTFRIPIGYKRILTETYGDYLSEPSVERCVKEVLESYNNLKFAKKA